MASYEELKKRVASGGDSTSQGGERKSTYEELRERTRQERIKSESQKVDDTYINTFLSNSSRYFDTAEEDYGKVGWGNASSSYQSRYNDWNSLRDSAEVIRNWLEANQGQGAAGYDDLVSYLDKFDSAGSSILDSFKGAQDYYAQWETEDAYNKFLADQKEYEDTKNFDADTAQKEINALESVLEEYKKLTRFTTDEEGARRAARIREQYGDEKAIKALISEKKQHLNKTKYAQKGILLSEAAYEEDFESKSGYQTTIKDNAAWWQSGGGDTQYEWINDQDGFRDAWEQDQAELFAQAGASSQSGFYAGPPKSVYYQHNYDQMTDNEVAIYNYYYAKEGRDKAQEYLDSIQEQLNYRKAEGIYGSIEESLALEMLFGVNAGLDQFKSGINALLNADEDYIPSSAVQMASGMVRQDLSDAGPMLPGLFGEVSLGQAAYDAVTTGANMAPSILTSMAVGMINPAAGAVTGNVLMGASAAGNAYQEALNQGYDKSQAGMYATLIGGSEALLGELLGGISNLGGTSKYVTKMLDGVDNAFWRFAGKMGGSMASEGFEEGLQEVLSPMFENLIFHKDEDVNWSEVAYSALLGALTAGVMEGPSTISEEVGTYKTGKQLQAADITADRLAEIGKTFSADTVAYQLAGRVDESTGAYTMGRLFNEIGANITEQNVNEMTEALVAKGMERGTARKNAEALAYVVAGGQLTDMQIAVIEANEALAEVARTTLVDNNTTWFQRTKGYNEALMALAQEKAAPKTATAEATLPGQKEAPASDTAVTQNKSGAESLAEADIGPAKVASIASIQKGVATIKLEDGSEVNVKEADLDPDDGVRIETIASIDGISAADANFILGTLKAAPGASAQMDSLGAKEAYKYGYYGFSQEHIAKHGVFANSLSEAQRNAIYETGRKARQTQVEKATPKKATGAKNAQAGKVHFEGDRSRLTERQSASLTAMEKVADALGVQIHVFESKVGENGKRIGANGWYDPKDNSIHIDLHAGANGEGTMMFTLAHELTHYIRQWSPAKFKTLADFLMQEYGKKGVNVDGLVREQMRKAKRNGRSISYDTAYEEVVADSMETMLSDGKVMEKLEKLKQRDESLWQKIKDFIGELAAKIRSVYEGMAPDSVEGRYVAEMKDSIEKLQELFTEALVDASENDQAGLTPGQGGKKYSFGGENARNADTDALVEAKKMQRTGVSMAEIFKETGWYQGADGKWRFEIDDSGMKFDRSGDLKGTATRKRVAADRADARKALEAVADEETMQKVKKYDYTWILDDTEDRKKAHEELAQGEYAKEFLRYAKATEAHWKNYEGGSEMKVGDYLYHPELFARYPGLEDIGLAFYDLSAEEGLQGFFTGDLIVLDKSLRDAADSVLIHELQHAIQHEEGFEGGSSTEFWQMVQEGENPKRVTAAQKQATARRVEAALQAVPESIAKEFHRAHDLLETGQDESVARDLVQGKWGEQFIAYEEAMFAQAKTSEVGQARDPGELYLNTAGEVESRDVQSRKALSAKERRNRLPNTGDEMTVFVNEMQNFHSAMGSVVKADAEAVASDAVLTDGAVVTDGDGVRYSIRSMKADIAEGQMFEDLKTYCGWSQKQVNELKNSLASLVEYMTPFRDILDMNETYGREGRRFSPYKPNSDPLYKISMDFSTLCSKRLLTQYVIESLQLRENRPMTAEEQMAIRDMLNEYRAVEKGLQVACAMCYVEAARLKSPKQISKWMADPETQMRNFFADKNPEFAAFIKEKQADFKESRGYARNATKKDMSAKDVRELNKIRPRLRSQYQVSAEEAKIIERAKVLPNSTYLTAANLANLSETDPTIYSAYTAFVRTATRSKSLETDEPYYYGDSRRDNGNGIIVSDSFIEEVNRENGMRFSSWSDWRIQHMLDYITAVIDNSVRGAAMHGYTKFGDEVRVLGKTGMMFNMSGVAGTQTGLNEDGSLSFSPTESIDANEAIQLREEFPDTAGLQCIGVGDDHIVALLRSDIIDYIIPYHVSGLNAALRRMANIHGWKNYTSTQHAAIDKSIKLEDAVDQEHWHEEPVYSEFFVGYDTGMTGIEAMRASAERYKQMCKERGLKPKFEQFSKEENYWKLLIDRKMINQKTGKLIQQKPVTPTFDFGTIKEVVDRYVQNYDSNLESRALNHIVENWDSIPKRIRDLKKQSGTKAKKVKKAADTLANQALAAQPTDGTGQFSDNDAFVDSHVKYSERVTDQETLDFLNGQKTITTYKTMQIVDGKLYPPMAARTNGAYEDYSVLGEWEQATEHPELIRNGNKFKLDKGKGQGSLEAAYNPYMHSSNLVLNDQFSGAYTRNNLVTVECVVPVSEMTSGYHAQYAKDSVGWHAWHTGTVAGSIRKAKGIERQVFLSRWIKPVRIVPDSEVASMYKELLDGTDVAVPDNVVTPSLLKALKNAGVKTKESGRIKYSDRDSDGNQLSEDQVEFFENSKARDESGNLYVMYHGSRSPLFTEFDMYEGVWLTPDQRYAEVYAEMWHSWRDEDQDLTGLEQSVYADPDYRVYKMYANIENPLDLGEINEEFDRKQMNRLARLLGVPASRIRNISHHDGYQTVGYVYEVTRDHQFIEIAKEKGYDGFVASEKGRKTFCAFNAPNQVKLTTNEVPSGFYDIRYSDRDTESVSNRSLLANAFEGAAQNDIERKKIQEYRAKISLIDAEERKLNELTQKIRELSFAKGPKDTKAIRDLQFEAKQTANRISTYDKQLLRLEASKPLQDVLAREKQMAYQRAEKKGKEALAAYREKATKTQRALMDKWQESRKKGIESREKTAMRHKIQSVVGELNQLLLANDKKRHVPDSLKKAVADALALVNMDTVGAEERAAKYANLIAKETDPDKIDAYTVTMENILRQGEKMGQRLKELRDAYEEIQTSDDPDIANAYDPVIAGCLKELAGSIGNTSLRNMTIEQLSDVYDMYRMVLTRVRDANKTFLNDRKENISNLASRVVGEVRRVGGDHKYRAAILDPVRKFLWNNLKPVYAFEHMGSSTLTEVFDSVRAGEDTWAKDVTEARAYYLERAKKYGYDGWDFKKKYRFESDSGIPFELTLEQILSLYAYSKREQAHDHLRLGGFVFDSNIETTREKGVLKYKVNTADAHQITPEILADIIGKLSQNQMAFVDEMQEYLSSTMGAKGNEVTMKMYGVKLFKEKFYFPLKSAKQFLFEQNEVSGEVRIKNSGFTNKTVAKANNPVILSNFMDVWAGHVNDMSMYHAFVLPLEDFNRIFNYNSPKREGQPPVSVKGTIQSAYSPAAVSYVKDLITDLNGGARTDSTTGIINKMMGLFKKGSVFASLSVVVQQPSAIARAAALVDTKYFIGPKVDRKRHKALWDEVKQYAPVAIIKEMGYFDTNMGKSTQDFILGKEYSGFTEKMKALVTDSGYRDEILSKAPALADELAWCAIWDAVKREMHDKHKGLDVKSEPFLMLAGARFTEVIAKTQVYDSVLSRSANMRSKDTGMKMATAFMAEPTTSINMIADALLQGKRGNRKYARAAIGAVIASQIFNSILVSFVYAGRDDDEDKTYWEKYLGTLTGEALDSLNPATYIPFVKDIVSIVQGYDVERSDMAVVSDLWNAWQKLSSDDLSTYRKVELFAGSICQIFGLPTKNIMRDARGIYQTIGSFVSGQQTTKAGIGYAVKSALPEWLGGGETANHQQLYEAILSGDTAHIARVESRYKDQDAVSTAIRKALRENDPRVKEAAQAQINGDPSERVRIARLIIADGFSQDDVVRAINAEINAMAADESDSGTKKEKGFYTASDFAREIANGDQAAANAAKTDIIRMAQKDGKTAEEAEKSFNSSAKSELKELFLTGKISEQKCIQALTTYCGIDSEDAKADVQYWAFKQDYPDVYADDSWFDKYYEDVADSGISIDQYMQYRNRVKDITGEGKKERRLAVIDSLPISDAQKDALYYAEGWAASKIYEAPWR